MIRKIAKKTKGDKEGREREKLPSTKYNKYILVSHQMARPLGYL